MSRLRLTPMRIALVLGLAIGLVASLSEPTERLLDTRAIDLRLLARGPEEPSPEVVIVAVDNASIDKLGRWPWPRGVLAKLLDRIEEAEPSVIGFDIVQSEPTPPPDFEALQRSVDPPALEQLRKAFAGGSPDDKLLAESVERSGRVVLGYFFDFSTNGAEDASAATLTSYGAVQSKAPEPGTGGEALVPHATSVVPNLDMMTKAAKATGFFNTLPDTGDGYFRRAPMVIRHGDRMAMPLSLSMLTVARPGVQPRLVFDDAGVAGIHFGDRTIPVGEDGQLLLNYRGPGETFLHVPAVNLLEGRVSPETLRGKLVLVGVTATAVADVRATPFDGVYPGVEIHATALDNILRNDFLHQPLWTMLVEVAAIVLGSLVLGGVLQRVRGVAAAVFAIALVGLYLGLSQWLFLAMGVPLGIVYPIGAIGVVYAAISVHHFVTVDLEKRRTRDAFSRYLNPELARLVSENPDMLKLGGTRVCLTVLFSDIRGFTSISEGLEPETLVEVLNVYLGEMTGIVFDNSGTLDKYIGDAIMAVWGAPVACEDHAARACRAALEMGRRLRERQDEWMQRGCPKIAAGIGLHTGDMVAGNMGSQHHLSYTVMGDNVNLGSRLEGLTKMYGVSLLVSEATVEAAGEAFISRELDLVAVKGKALPVRIYEMMGFASDASMWTDLKHAFEEGLRLFRLRQWEDAAATFAALLERHPDDGPSLLYLKRCRAYAESPPPEDWRGVTVMETK